MGERIVWKEEGEEEEEGDTIVVEQIPMMKMLILVFFDRRVKVRVNIGNLLCFPLSLLLIIYLLSIRFSLPAGLIPFLPSVVVVIPTYIYT